MNKFARRQLEPCAPCSWEMKRVRPARVGLGGNIITFCCSRCETEREEFSPLHKPKPSSPSKPKFVKPQKRARPKKVDQVRMPVLPVSVGSKRERVPVAV